MERLRVSRPEEREEHGELNRGSKRMRRRKRGKSSVQESGGQTAAS